MVWEEESENVFEDEEYLKGWLASMHQKIYTDPLPDPLRGPFFEAFLERAIRSAQNQKRRDGRLTMPFNASRSMPSSVGSLNG